MRLLFVIDDLNAEVVLRLGAQLASLTDRPATLLTVVRHASERDAAADALRQACTTQMPDVPVAEVKVRVGRPADEILREAEEGRYGLLVIGEQQWSSRTLRLFDSVAERLARYAPCPILVAKGAGGTLRRVLVCDSGAIAPSVLERLAATGLLGLLGPATEVIVLHVMSQISAAPGIAGLELDADASDLIREHAPEGVLLEHDVKVLESGGLHPQAKVRHGFVVDEILDESCGGGYDLVVIGAHRDQRWQRLLLDDIAREIIVQCDRPVLVLR